MVINARLYKKARLVFFFASPRHFDFFNCKAKTSKCFKCELKCLDIIYRKKKKHTGTVRLYRLAKSQDCKTAL